MLEQRLPKGEGYIWQPGFTQGILTLQNTIWVSRRSSNTSSQSPSYVSVEPTPWSNFWSVLLVNIPVHCNAVPNCCSNWWFSMQCVQIENWTIRVSSLRLTYEGWLQNATYLALNYLTGRLRRRHMPNDLIKFEVAGESNQSVWFHKKHRFKVATRAIKPSNKRWTVIN